MLQNKTPSGTGQENEMMNFSIPIFTPCICQKQSSLPLFSTETIKFVAVTGAQGAGSTRHRWLRGHEKALAPIRATVTNMAVPVCPS